MMCKDELSEVKRLLREGDFTCVIVKGDNVFTSKERGVKPLISLLDADAELSGALAADKVVGKAAAMLYLLLNIKKLYASVISELALDTLMEAGIEVSYETLVPMIRNRTNTGFCPMEQVTKDIDDPNEALNAIRKTIVELKNKN